jgi:hypothetical protein
MSRQITLESPEEYLRKRIRINENGCWIWQRSFRCKFGYGDAFYQKKRQLAHRMAYEIFVGEIPEGLCVLHKCDVGSCCNPEHLFLGNHLVNAQDRVSKGRSNTPKGEANGMAKLTKNITIEIRRIANSVTISSMAKRYGVSRRAIKFVLEGATWN